MTIRLTSRALRPIGVKPMVRKEITDEWIKHLTTIRIDGHFRLKKLQRLRQNPISIKLHHLKTAGQHRGWLPMVAGCIYDVGD